MSINVHLCVENFNHVITQHLTVIGSVKSYHTDYWTMLEFYNLIMDILQLTSGLSRKIFYDSEYRCSKLCSCLTWYWAAICYTLKSVQVLFQKLHDLKMREIVHVQAGQCGNQIGAKFWEVIRCYILHLILPFSSFKSNYSL